MSMDGIRVTHAALEQASQDLAAGGKQIKERMTQLEQELSPLKEKWVGGAKDVYDRQKLVWDQAIGEMQGILTEASNMVMTSRQDYIDADKKGAAAFEF